MTGTLQDAERSALGTGTDPLQARAAVGQNVLNLQLFNSCAPPVLRICRSGDQNFTDQLSSMVRNEPQHGECFRNSLAFDDVNHQSGFAGRSTKVLSHGASFSNDFQLKGPVSADLNFKRIGECLRLHPNIVRAAGMQSDG